MLSPGFHVFCIRAIYGYIQAGCGLGQLALVVGNPARSRGVETR